MRVEGLGFSFGFRFGFRSFFLFEGLFCRPIRAGCGLGFKVEGLGFRVSGIGGPLRISSGVLQGIDQDLFGV